MTAINRLHHAAWITAFLLGTSVTGMADEDICVHGQSGQLQTSTGDDTGHYGDGFVTPFDANWIHYSIPTPSGQNTLKAIKVKLETGYLIDKIHVWDSDVRIKPFTLDELRKLGLHTGQGIETIVLPFENPVSSVGVSIHYTMGGGGGVAASKIHSVCGTFGMVQQWQPQWPPGTTIP